MTSLSEEAMLSLGKRLSRLRVSGSSREKAFHWEVGFVGQKGAFPYLAGPVSTTTGAKERAFLKGSAKKRGL